MADGALEEGAVIDARFWRRRGIRRREGAVDGVAGCEQRGEFEDGREDVRGEEGE